jgi:enamine deaminase RidA (YjgF/YER057c/UK114 family)
MDACSVKGLKPGQVTYLYAKDHLSPTHEYGVTFERGTAITYGDRRQIYISGTASIDHKGDVLHIGDIEQQTLRMLENIRALLDEGGMTLDDIAMAIVYLRDTADAQNVRHILTRELPALNYVMVLAPVCRPTWLVEMECIAMRAMSDNRYNPF